jgi:hypothetical protein
VTGPNPLKSENPSVATLDTLARYVLRAPYTTEIKRKDDESHFPYWFLYKEQYNRSAKKKGAKRWFGPAFFWAGSILVAILLLLYFDYIRKRAVSEFSDDFKKADDRSLVTDGWEVKNPDPVYWKKKEAVPGKLTLFTLKGDNWPDQVHKPGIKNLLLRKIPYDCFTAELHMDGFIPEQEWQQAGILLLEDTTLSGKSIRLSLAYNDYFGGYPASKEILVQGITSIGNGFGKPEEVAHKPVLLLDSLSNNPVLIKNLAHTALRIEKEGSKFRLLYSGGEVANTAFKEIANLDFDMQPRYIGIFAIKGFKDSTASIPVYFTFFRLSSALCK